MEAGRLFVPVLMLVGTLAFAFYWAAPRLEIRRSARILGRSLKVVTAQPELTGAKVLVIQCDSGLRPIDTAGKRVVKAGRLEEEQADWKRKFGTMEPGEFAITRGGALDADYVVFACPPLSANPAFLISILTSISDGLHANSVAFPLFPATPIPDFLSALESARLSSQLADLYIYSADEKALATLSVSL